MTAKLIEVGSTSCGVCKMMKPMVDKAVSKFDDKLEFIYVYGDTEEGKKIMEENSISDVSNVPTFFFIKDGEIKETLSGGISMPALTEKINNII